MRLYLVAFWFIAFAHQSLANVEKAHFFEISRDGRKALILGSLHTTSPQSYPFEVRQILEQQLKVFTEIDLNSVVDSMNKIWQSKVLFSDKADSLISKRLTHHSLNYSEDENFYLARLFELTAPLSHELNVRLKLGHKIADNEILKLLHVFAELNGMDGYLAKHYQENGLEVGFLEDSSDREEAAGAYLSRLSTPYESDESTPSSVVNDITRIIISCSCINSLKSQLSLFIEKSAGEVNTMFQRGRIHSVIGQQDLMGVDVLNRNRMWIPVIEQAFAEAKLKEDGSTGLLFVFGALHLVGDEGVLNLLNQRGYHIKIYSRQHHSFIGSSEISEFWGEKTYSPLHYVKTVQALQSTVHEIIPPFARSCREACEASYGDESPFATWVECKDFCGYRNSEAVNDIAVRVDSASIWRFVDESIQLGAYQTESDLKNRWHKIRGHVTEMHFFDIYSFLIASMMEHALGEAKSPESSILSSYAESFLKPGGAIHIDLSMDPVVREAHYELAEGLSGLLFTLSNLDVIPQTSSASDLAVGLGLSMANHHSEIGKKIDRRIANLIYSFICLLGGESSLEVIKPIIEAQTISSEKNEEIESVLELRHETEYLRRMVHSQFVGRGFSCHFVDAEKRLSLVCEKLEPLK